MDERDHQMADEHNHGAQSSGMDIRAQEKTFDGFVGMMTKVVVVIVVLVVFMALANA